MMSKPRGLDVGQGELGPVVGPDGAHDAAEHDEGRDPGDQDAKWMGMAPTAKAGKHERVSSVGGGWERDVTMVADKLFESICLTVTLVSCRSTSIRG